MDARTLQTEARAATGKGAARQLRMQGRVPGILYGRGVDSTMLSLAPKDLSSLLSREHRRNQLIDLRLDGAQHFAMIVELQVHPVTRAFLHVDFLKVDPAAAIEVRVPVRATGRAKGVLAGGELRAQYRQLPVRARPAEIPAEIVVDVSELDLNQSVHVRDLPLPAGVSAALDGDRTVFSCAIPRRPPEEETAAAEAAAPAAGEGAAAAPEGEAKTPEGDAAGAKPAAKPEAGKAAAGKAAAKPGARKKDE